MTMMDLMCATIDPIGVDLVAYMGNGLNAFARRGIIVTSYAPIVMTFSEPSGGNHHQGLTVVDSIAIHSDGEWLTGLEINGVMYGHAGEQSKSTSRVTLSKTKYINNIYVRWKPKGPLGSQHDVMSYLQLGFSDGTSITAGSAHGMLRHYSGLRVTRIGCDFRRTGINGQDGHLNAMEVEYIHEDDYIAPVPQSYNDQKKFNMVVQVLSGPLNSTEILTSHSRVLKSTADRFELVTDSRIQTSIAVDLAYDLQSTADFSIKSMNFSEIKTELEEASGAETKIETSIEAEQIKIVYMVGCSIWKYTDPSTQEVNYVIEWGGDQQVSPPLSVDTTDFRGYWDPFNLLQLAPLRPSKASVVKTFGINHYVAP